jgi:hypothetical protein
MGRAVPGGKKQPSAENGVMGDAVLEDAIRLWCIIKDVRRLGERDRKSLSTSGSDRQASESVL